MGLDVSKRWHLSPRVTAGAGTMLHLLLLRPFLWGASAGNIHKPFLRHISCPVVGYKHWQVRWINRMKNIPKKKNPDTHRAQPFQHARVRPGCGHQESCTPPRSTFPKKALRCNSIQTWNPNSPWDTLKRTSKTFRKRYISYYKYCKATSVYCRTIMQIRIQDELDCLGEGQCETLYSTGGVVGQKKNPLGICLRNKGNRHVNLHSAPPSHSGYLVANGSFSNLLCSLNLFGDKFLWVSALRKYFIKPLLFIFVMGQVGKNMLITDPGTTASIIGSSVFSRSLNLCILLKG